MKEIYPTHNETVVAIVAECNPLHKGHIEIIKYAKAHFDDVIVILSGPFVQRGEPAIFDKWLRTKQLLEEDVSLVLELSPFFAMSSAESFAYGAIKTLESTGIVTDLLFGSESGTIDTLMPLATILHTEPPLYKKYLHTYLKMGVSFPHAREKALTHFTMDISPLTIGNANNILGVEYLKALLKTKSSIRPITIKRLPIKGKNISATTIRNEIKNGVFDEASLSPQAIKRYQQEVPVYMDDFFMYFHFQMRQMPLRDLKNIWGMKEGLHNRIYHHLGGADNFSLLIKNIHSKRFTYTFISRLLLAITLGIKKDDVPKNPPYIRVLGFQKEKEYLLSRLHKKATLPVITQVNGAFHTIQKDKIPYLMEEEKLNRLYHLAKGELSLYEERRMPMIIQ